MLACVLCLQSFDDTSVLHEHIHWDHEGQHTLSCTLCEAYFDSSNQLDSHWRLVHQGHNQAKIRAQELPPNIYWQQKLNNVVIEQRKLNSSNADQNIISEAQSVTSSTSGESIICFLDPLIEQEIVETDIAHNDFPESGETENSGSAESSLGQAAAASDIGELSTKSSSKNREHQTDSVFRNKDHPDQSAFVFRVTCKECGQLVPASTTALNSHSWGHVTSQGRFKCLKCNTVLTSIKDHFRRIHPGTSSEKAIRNAHIDLTTKSQIAMQRKKNRRCFPKHTDHIGHVVHPKVACDLCAQLSTKCKVMTVKDSLIRHVLGHHSDELHKITANLKILKSKTEANVLIKGYHHVSVRAVCKLAFPQLFVLVNEQGYVIID